MGCLSTAADAAARRGASGPPASRPRDRSPRACAERQAGREAPPRSASIAFADAGARFISPAARFRAACYGGMLCVGASVLACYALLTYRWRARHILAKDQPEWGDPQGPLLVTVVVIIMLLSAWVAER